MNDSVMADLILYNGKIATMGGAGICGAIAVKKNKVVATGSDQEIMNLRSPETGLIDLGGRTVIPGLNDSHIHLIRGGLNYNLELRWDGVRSLADALLMLKKQVERTPAPQWVRVIGGWNEFQFKEKRLPTLAEINAIAPETPVFILHLYDSAILNRAALRAIGYDEHTPNPPGGEIQRDSDGRPTGLLIAKPNAMILYYALSKGPKLEFDDQVNSTRQFMHELNRLGVTSVIDAGGGFQNYPDDYKVINQLHSNGQMTVRVAYNLFTQRPKEERLDFERWTHMTSPGAGDSFLRMNGAGEMLVFSAADFEDFLEPRPDLAGTMESELKDVVRTLAKAKWPFRLHATYNETIDRALNVFEEVNREIPFEGLRWFFDHAETISPKNIERVKALGGGIAVQHRMAFQGEYFHERYGSGMTKHSPPIREMLKQGLPVGAGTDATRVASYNPFVALSWMATGRTIGGMQLYDETNLLQREEALRLYTAGSAWFSSEDEQKGTLVPGALADLAVLDKDFFTVPDEQIAGIESVLTVVDGLIVYASEHYEDLSPPALPVSPTWSPAAHGSRYGAASLSTSPFAHLAKKKVLSPGSGSGEMSSGMDAHSHSHTHSRNPFNSNPGCAHQAGWLNEVKTLLNPSSWARRECDCFVF